MKIKKIRLGVLLFHNSLMQLCHSVFTYMPKTRVTACDQKLHDKLQRCLQDIYFSQICRFMSLQIFFSTKNLSTPPLLNPNPNQNQNLVFLLPCKVKYFKFHQVSESRECFTYTDLVRPVIWLRNIPSTSRSFRKSDENLNHSAQKSTSTQTTHNVSCNHRIKQRGYEGSMPMIMGGQAILKRKYNVCYFQSSIVCHNLKVYC